MQPAGFSPAEEAMIARAMEALGGVGYDASPLQTLIRADMPEGHRGVRLSDGAVLSGQAFTSQAILNHVLEEELLHHYQMARDPNVKFGPGTARRLEQEADEQRQFPLPES